MLFVSPDSHGPRHKFRFPASARNIVCGQPSNKLNFLFSAVSPDSHAPRHTFGFAAFARNSACGQPGNRLNFLFLVVSRDSNGLRHSFGFLRRPPPPPETMLGPERVKANKNKSMHYHVVCFCFLGGWGNSDHKEEPPKKEVKFVAEW